MPSDRAHSEKGLGDLNTDDVLSSEVLSVPSALGEALGPATVRAAPEDFQVDEWLGFEADGEGDHMLLRVRKRSANTFWVAKQLARISGVHPRDVGYAGLKDRDAIAEQSFTVPLRSRVADQWLGVNGEGFEVIAASRHRRKLKRGALKGNAFKIVLRDFPADPSRIEERLQRISANGVPNYFGPQRFGREAQNIRVATRWFEGGRAPQDRLERGFAISAARSALFNLILAERVRTGTWNRLLEGDLANLDGSGSIFAVESLDDVLIQRCETMDIHPSGPLWHGDSAASGTVREIELAIASQYPKLCEGLAKVGLEPERRALRVRVSDLAWTIEANTLHLSFRLGKGAFATAVLHEIIDNAFASDMPESD